VTTRSLYDEAACRIRGDVVAVVVLLTAVLRA